LFYSLVKVQCDVCVIDSSSFSSLSGQLGEWGIGDHYQPNNVDGLIMYAHRLYCCNLFA